MKHIRRGRAEIGLAALLLFSCMTAVGASPDQPSAGVGFVEGGIGLEDAALLDADRMRYSLEVRTAARGSGAYLADVHLTIRDASNAIVFDRQLQGPRLLIDLRPGPYDIVGVRAGEVTRQHVTLPPKGHREAVLYFPVEGEARPYKPAEDGPAPKSGDAR